MAQDGARSQLASLLLDAWTVREHLDDFVLHAGSRLGGDTHCSVSVRHRGQDRLAASSGPRPAACDEVEFRHGSGPCVTAMDDRRVVLVADAETETRWPHWCRAAAEAGFRSSAAVPAHVREGAEVALNLYSESVDAWEGEALLRADRFAREVARTVGLCLRVAELAQRMERIGDAVAARDVLNQAVGAVMATNRCTAVEALELLRGVAANRDVDVVDVARATVEGATGSQADPRGPAEP
jgi:GAF domain/ANTAR domain